MLSISKISHAITFSKIILLFCAIAIFTEITSWISSGFWALNNLQNPYFQYFQNPGIKKIFLLSVILDSAILFTLIFTRITSRDLFTRFLLIDLCCLAIGTIWAELWFGSTFYYGEVRDKQGLFLGVNNFGIIGSYLFSTYAIWLIPIRFRSFKGIQILHWAGAIVLAIGHLVLWYILEEPWKLWQS